jgi:hypothetical protein
LNFIDTKKVTMTVQETVQKGVDLFAKTEIALADATACLLELQTVYIEGYYLEALDGSTALEEAADSVSIAGEIAAIKNMVLAKHRRATEFAKSAGADIDTPYAELPPRDGKKPRSGGGR